MAHRAASKHSRLTRLLKKRNYSEAYNGETARQGPGDNHRSTWTASASSSGIDSCESEVKQHDESEDNSAHRNSDLLGRQQTVLPPASPTKVLTAVVDISDSHTQPQENPTTTASGSDLSQITTATNTASDSGSSQTTLSTNTASGSDSSQTTIPTISPTSPVSSVSTDSSLHTLSPHVPDKTISASPAPTSPTSDTPTSTALTSAKSTSLTTSNTLQSSPPSTKSNRLFSSSSATSSTSLTSTGSLTTASATSTSTSNRESDSSSSTGSTGSANSTDSTDSTNSTGSTGNTDSSSLTSTDYISAFSTGSGPTGFFGGYPGPGGGGGTTATASVPGSTATNPPPQSSSPTPTTNKIVGGVVGSVAGVAFLFVMILLYLRRRHAALRAARDGLPAGDVAGGAAGEGSVAQSAEMTSRQSSHDPLFASFLAPAFMKNWRKSTQSTGTDNTLVPPPSERGFQKVAGRKIPSVLRSGGDGYGGGFGEAPPGTEMSVNFQSSPSNNNGPSASQPPTASAYGMPLDTNYTRENQGSPPEVIIRPSPARTPTASSTNLPSTAAQTPPRSTPEPQSSLSPSIPRRPDLLGRSHPSLDGSRSSRFTESIS